MLVRPLTVAVWNCLLTEDTPYVVSEESCLYCRKHAGYKYTDMSNLDRWISKYMNNKDLNAADMTNSRQSQMTNFIWGQKVLRSSIYRQLQCVYPFWKVVATWHASHNEIMTFLCNSHKMYIILQWVKPLSVVTYVFQLLDGCLVFQWNFSCASRSQNSWTLQSSSCVLFTVSSLETQKNKPQTYWPHFPPSKQKKASFLLPEQMAEAKRRLQYVIIRMSKFLMGKAVHGPAVHVVLSSQLEFSLVQTHSSILGRKCA